MNPTEEYAELIRIRDERHERAKAENAKLKAELRALVGITLLKQEFDRVTGSLSC
jgi:hypothetical protein